MATDTVNVDRFHDVRTLLAEDELEAAVQQLAQLARAASGRLADEAVLLMGRVRGWERRRRAGAETADALRADRAGLCAAALGLLNDVAGATLRPLRPVPRVELGRPDVEFEKLYGLAPLRDLAWLRQGLIAARSVCRISAESWHGTGFVAAGRWVITNHHVLPSPEIADHAGCDFNCEDDLDGRPLPVERYRLDPATYRGNEALDVACARLIDRGDAPLTAWGALVLAPAPGLRVGDHVAIIQHPDGGPKKIAMGGNQIVNLYQHRVQYMTDTMPGSSGAPVFDDRWRVAAVHHAGGNLEKNARGDRIYANEGILADDIVKILFPQG